MSEEMRGMEGEVPFAVALRRGLGRVTGNAGKGYRTHEIARDVNVSHTTIHLTEAGRDGPDGLLVPTLRLVEDHQSQHWGGHAYVTLCCVKVEGYPRDADEGGFSDQARVLVDHLLKTAANGNPGASFRGKRVVELGAGTGLVGLALAAAGAEVMLTDQAAGLPILERNAEANADAFKKAQCTIPTVHKLTWGGDVEHLRPPVDVIVCSDCIYMATSVEPLVQTMLRLSDERTAIWVAHQHRNPGVEVLFRQRAEEAGLSLVQDVLVERSDDQKGPVKFSILLLRPRSSDVDAVQ